MRHPFPSPTPRLIRVAPPLSDLCGVLFWDSYCFCVATCETTGLVQYQCVRIVALFRIALRNARRGNP
jgi:hypothetical protein